MNKRLKRLVFFASAAGLASVVIWMLMDKSAPSAVGPDAPPARHAILAHRAAVEAASKSRGNSEAPHEATPRPEPVSEALVAALGEAAKETDFELREEKLKALALAVPVGSILRTVEALTASENLELGRDLRQQLLERWLDLDAAGVSAWVADLPPGASRTEALRDLVRPWATRDLDSAVAWVRQLGRPEEVDGALVEIGYTLAPSNPVQALKLAVDMAPAEPRNELIYFAAAQWAGEKGQEAVAWAREVADKEMREPLLAGVLTVWADSAPLAAANEAVKSLTPGRAQNDAIVGIVQRWAQKEPAAVADWVSGFPDGELRNTVTEELVKLWADQDLESAGQWADTQSSGSARDFAIGAFISKITPLSPETAAVWTPEIEDQVRRNDEIERVAEMWLAADAPAAVAWLSAVEAPEGVKTRVLARTPLSDEKAGVDTASPAP